MTRTLGWTLSIAGATLIALLWAPTARADQVGEVNVTALHVRAGPGTHYPVLDTVHEGDRVTIEEHSGRWARIARVGGEGWVHSGFLDLAPGPDRRSADWFLGRWHVTGDDVDSGAYEAVVDVERNEGGHAVTWRTIRGSASATGSTAVDRIGTKLIYRVARNPRGIVGVLADAEEGEEARVTWTRHVDGSVEVRVVAGGRVVREGRGVRVDDDLDGVRVHVDTTIGEGRRLSAPAADEAWLVLGGERLRLEVGGPADARTSEAVWTADEGLAGTRGAAVQWTVPVAVGDHQVEVRVPRDGAPDTVESLTFRVRDVSSGSSGNDVRMLQERLVALGYRSPGTDGVFGPRSSRRFRAFREANGMRWRRMIDADVRRILATHVRDYEAALAAFPQDDLRAGSEPIDRLIREASAHIDNLPAGTIPTWRGRSGEHRILRALLGRETDRIHWRDREIVFSRTNRRDVGALGIGQIMPFHSSHYHRNGAFDLNLYRPDHNLRAAVEIIDDVLDHGFDSRVRGDSARDALAKAFAAYNAGQAWEAYSYPWSEIRRRSLLPRETIRYAENILADLGL